MPRQLFDPIVEQLDRRLIDELRADVRHPAMPRLGHSEIEHRAIGIAWGDDLSVADAESALFGRGEQFRFGQRDLGSQLDLGCASRAELMAVGAVHLQIRPRPAIEIGRGVVGIHERRNRRHPPPFAAESSTRLTTAIFSSRDSSPAALNCGKLNDSRFSVHGLWQMKHSLRPG